MNGVLTVDIVIVGGGIAGLWLLSRLRALGYSVLLVESSHLGAGQTIASQGIIHGSAGYALSAPDADAQAVSDRLDVWQRCLAGTGEVDLSRVQRLAQHQYLWIPTPPRTWRLVSLLTRKKRAHLRSVLNGSDALNDDDYPPALCHKRFRGNVYRLDEPVVDTASLLQALADQHREALVLNQGPAVMTSDGAITLRAAHREPLMIRPQCTVFTAGVGNLALGWIPLQVQHLQMIMVRGKDLPAGFYAHCLGDYSIPRLTITSHRDAHGRTIWYLGGQLAEESIRHRAKQQIREARRELTELLPWIDWSAAEFATLRVARVWSRRHAGASRDAPSIFQAGKVIVAWPNRLTLAPKLADEVLAVLKRIGVRPAGADLGRLADWPRPQVAAYPWDDKNLVWS